MTEKEIYKNGVVLLEEWEDVNYCEHNFKFKYEWLTDKEVVDLLSRLNDDNEQLKQLLEVIRHELVALSGLKAFDICADKTENLTCVWNKDLIELNYNKLIKMIDNELEE